MEQNPVQLPAPAKTSFFNRFKNWKYLVGLVLILLILVFPLVYFLISNKTVSKQEPSPSPSSSSINLTFPLYETFKAGYAFRKNADLTYDYFIVGTVQKVVDNKDSYSITLKSTFGKTYGQIFTFNLPKIPPKEGQTVLGKDFKEMFDRGFKTVDLRIRYDNNNQVIEWELLQKVNLK